MSKITCSVRLSSELKNDLDHLSEFNGQTLGHMVNAEMSDMLLEIIDEQESMFRDCVRRIENLQLLLTYPKAVDNPDFKFEYEEFDSLDRKNNEDGPFWFALTIAYRFFDDEFGLQDIQGKLDEFEKELREYKQFLNLADTFNSIINSVCLNWLEDGKITRAAKINLQERYDAFNTKDEWQERLHKIERRYGFPNLQAIWNGEVEASARFLNRIYREFPI